MGFLKALQKATQATIATVATPVAAAADVTGVSLLVDAIRDKEPRLWTAEALKEAARKAEEAYEELDD